LIAREDIYLGSLESFGSTGVMLVQNDFFPEPDMTAIWVPAETIKINSTFSKYFVRPFVDVKHDQVTGGTTK